MRSATSINIFFDPTFTVHTKTQVQRAYDAGFRAIDMNFWDYAHDKKNSPFTQNNWEHWVHEIDDAAKQLGIAFTQAHAHVYNFYQGNEAQYELYERSLRGSALLGIEWLVFHPSASPDHNVSQMIDDNAAFYRPLIALAEKLHVGIALENMAHPAYGFTSAEQLLTLVQKLDSDRVAVCWDTGHAHIAKRPQGEEIRMLGKKLQALHVQDNDGLSDQHMPPYFGTIDWKEIMQALVQIQFPNDFMFEAHMLVRKMPPPLKAAAARLLFQIGTDLVQSFA